MFKRLKLAQKLALVIGSVLTLIFIILITVTALISKSVVSSSVYGELNVSSMYNSQQLQEIFTAADIASSNVQSYLEKSYRLAVEKPSENVFPSSQEAIDFCTSVIYGISLTPLHYDTEQYISETARNTAVNNPDIESMGVMFEPYKFQKDIRDYAFYVDSNNATSKIEPYSNYKAYSQEIFYKDAAEAKAPVVTDPYDFNGTKLITYAKPILYDNELKGVVIANINLERFKKIDAVNARYPSMFATVYDDEGDIIYDTEDFANIGKNLSDFTPDKSELAQVQAKMAQGESFQIETTRQGGTKITRFFSPLSAGTETWWALTGVETRDANEAIVETVIWLISLSVAALVIIILTTMFVLKKMLHPMKDVISAAEDIAAGHLDVSLSVNSQDEIGILSGAFQNMSNNLKSIVDDVRYLLGEMADGNFNIKTRAEERYVGDFETFILSMRKLNQKLSDTLMQINQSSEQVASGSDQVSSGAQALSQGATEQASSVEELAATINEISSQVAETAQNAAEAREQTKNSGDEVTLCNTQMHEMINAINEISEKSNEIGKIIKTIEDIAFQTNILALNAAVEAARAGEAGKGFAVVADEVRNLASKSAEASKNTASLIEGSIRAVEKGTTIANETAKSLMLVVESAQQVSVTVDKIAESANTQAASIDQVTQGIDQISSVVQTNSATAEESAAASEELSGQSQILKSLVNQFKLKDTNGVHIQDTHSVTPEFGHTDDSAFPPSTDNKY